MMRAIVDVLTSALDALVPTSWRRESTIIAAAADGNVAAAAAAATGLCAYADCPDVTFRRTLETLRADEAAVAFCVDAHRAYHEQPLSVFASGVNRARWTRELARQFPNAVCRPLDAYDEAAARTTTPHLQLVLRRDEGHWQVSNRHGFSVGSNVYRRDSILATIAELNPIPHRVCPPNDGTRRPLLLRRDYGKNAIARHGGFYVQARGSGGIGIGIAADPRAVAVGYAEVCPSYYTFTRDADEFRLLPCGNERLLRVLEALVTDAPADDVRALIDQPTSIGVLTSVAPEIEARIVSLYSYFDVRVGVVAATLDATTRARTCLYVSQDADTGHVHFWRGEQSYTLTTTTTTADATTTTTTSPSPASSAHPLALYALVHNDAASITQLFS
jgi:hypothetical protein